MAARRFASNLHGAEGPSRSFSSPEVSRDFVSAERSEVNNMRFDHTVETTAPPERIWIAWTTVRRWPERDTELISATLEGGFALCAKGTLKPKKGPASGFTISELTPGESYAFTTRLPLCE